MPSAIHFDEATHTYTDEHGQVVPSVTQALAVLDSYRGIPAPVLEKAAQRGTAVHRAVELHLQDDLDELSLAPEIADYFYAYWKFEREFRYRAEHAELRVFSNKFRYAGTLDLAGPDPISKRGEAIIDIKTSRELMPSVGPQLAAYERAYREVMDVSPKKKLRRYGLLLKRDGTYELKPYDGSADFSVFLACLTVHNYKEQ